MALVKGQALVDPVTGLAGRIYTKMVSNPDAGLAAGATTVGSAARKALAAICQAFGDSVIDEIQANATVIIKTTDAGLQRDNTAGNPATLAPAANKTLPGGAVQ